MKVETDIHRSVPAILCFNHEELCLSGVPGSYSIVPVWDNDKPTEEIDCLIILCPGCGRESALSIRRKGQQITHPSWNLIDRQSLTLTPSIYHNPERKGCGWHGFLSEQEF